MSRGLGRMEQAILASLPDNDGSMSEYYPNTPSFHRLRNTRGISRTLAKSNGKWLNRQIIEYRLKERVKSGVMDAGQASELLKIIRMAWSRSKGHQEDSFKASFSRSIRRLVEKGLIAKFNGLVYKC